MNEPIKILVCDDHAMVRAGIIALIEQQPDMQVLGQAVDATDARHKAASLQPDVVLLDLSMPGGGGLAAIGEIRAVSPASRVLCVTMHDDPAYARRAKANGSTGYLVKSAGDGELVAAIRAVSAGVMHFSRSVMQKAISGGHEIDGVEKLSRREREVLLQLARGHTQREVAEMLGVSVKTVQTYRGRVASKLSLPTRAAMVKFAMASGLLEETAAEQSR